MSAVTDRNDYVLNPKAPTKLPRHVTREGSYVSRLIDGVKIRPLITHPDPRGSLTEMYDLRWEFHDEPLVYTYFCMIRPGQVKAWIRHELQDDRLAFMHGDIQVVLYDARPESPTHGLLNNFTFGTSNRSLVCIPIGVYHGLRNVGDHPAYFINHPTKPYNHDNPDKLLLPLENDIIPYKFR